MRGLYIHIPFCESICHYCDFVKRIPKDDAMVTDYLDVLSREIAHYRSRYESFDTIYVGGGTPSMLSKEDLDRLFLMLQGLNPLEYTIEVNPESYTTQKGLRMKAAGINRVSLGVQTTDPGMRRYLNRRHSDDDVLFAINDLRRIGITNISVDLIFGIPGQTRAMIDRDLEMVRSLRPDHLSWYQLILEEKTVFHHLYRHGMFTPVAEDELALTYRHVTDALEGSGYRQYEISNYAAEGKESLHNTLYWTMQDYVGVGLGAHGFIDGVRYENNRLLGEYEKAFVKDSHMTTPDERMADHMIFGLRMNRGVDLDEIKRLYGRDPFEAYPELDDHLNEGLVMIEDNRIMLTERGRLLGNQVFMAFV
jgi:oxygen-independent coproporphyrinogen III oxidase